MPADQTPRVEHGHFAWSPLPLRPALRWPTGQPVAVCPIVTLEYFEQPQPEGSLVPTDLAGGLGRRPYPDYPMLAHREYGHRVGIFRVVSELRRWGFTPTVAIDALTARHYPALVEHLQDAGCQFLAHGISVSRTISSLMSTDDEVDYIQETKATLSDAGITARGWLSPEYNESGNTPRLLADAGYEYVCDWLNDEQPYQMNYGGLVSLPLMCDYDDAWALSKREMTLDGYQTILQRGFDQLALDGTTSARVLAFQFRPWLLGQPHRIGVLRAFLEHVTSGNDSWLATADEIVSAYRGRPQS